ncbi:MAG: tRNA (guanosine(37)-N1)-methyltransferase TrmD [Ruminococcaceae bacterium]|nr:tRNA (guanosine(37)-N1)-methyltransferase TrmD [Oscillospiraceae bacterium]
MRIDFLTLFPEMFKETLGESIIARGASKGLLDLNFFQIRDYTEDKQKKVDDYPYGGGPGLVMSYQPIVSAYHAAVESAGGEKPHVIYMTPQGKVHNQKIAKRLSKMPYIMIICGHYEGIDERIIEDIVDEEISLGDFVLTGGEIPAMALADSVGRLVPGVLASVEATESESHSEGLLEYPQYTRPEVIAGKKVPDVLLGGNHADIEKWRLEQSEDRTKRKRPDMYSEYKGSIYDPNREIYLDNSATTKQSKAVTEEMCRIYRDFYGNPSSLHRLGFEAEKELKRCRGVLADIIAADESEIYFTSGGSESNNWALRGYLEKNPRQGKHIIISAIEHPSVSETANALKNVGFEVSLVPVSQSGVVLLSELEKLIRPDTALISVMHVNSETGAIQPISEISKLRYKLAPDAVLHVDAVQSFGKIAIDVNKMGIDLLSVSAHKIHGPRGVGMLYIRKGVRVAPLIYGGGQEKGLRSGTENLAGIAGFVYAAKEMTENIDVNYDHVSSLNKKLFDMLTERFGDKIVITTDREVSSPYVLNVAFPKFRAEVILHSLESKNVYVSVGSACSSHKKNRSTVLTAMGYPNNVIDGAIRISFSAQNTEDDVEKAFDAINRTIRELKSAVYAGKRK